MNFFKNFPEFVDLDSRKYRESNPINSETLDTRHEVALPREVVENCTVLDLGSCLGATGHWVLSNGCFHYTGVEIQPKMVEDSRSLLSKYWRVDQFTIVKQDIRDFLKQSILENKKWDVVVAVGVVYAFLDTYGFLKEITEVANKVVVIDSLYPRIMSKFPSIDILRDQNINSQEKHTVFLGAGARPDPRALKILMESLNFISRDGLLHPRPLIDKSVHDTYNTIIDRPWDTDKRWKFPSRYIIRFDRIKNTKLVEVGKLVVENNEESKISMIFNKPPFANVPTWKFDQSVADRFQKEAEQHIPDYQRVIDICYSMTESIFPNSKDINIIDVGSALGHTMDTFIKNNYTNVWGVDNSPDMINSSKHSDKVILSESFPLEKTWDVVLANWTLHFIKEKEKYLTNIFESLNDNGILILSDKMPQHPVIKEMYYQWKMSNGITIDEIKEKEKKLIGILLAETLEAYLGMLHRIGFTKVDLINSRFNFNTLLCCK
jgi:SAM-dependent methyltransferase